MASKRKAGRPRLSGKGKGRSPYIGVRFGADLLARIDKWRKAHPDQPTRSEALRVLAESGLGADGF